MNETRTVIRSFLWEKSLIEQLLAQGDALGIIHGQNLNGGVARNAVNYRMVCFALSRCMARSCFAVADWIFGLPGGFSVFLCGQSRAFLLPVRT